MQHATERVNDLAKAKRRWTEKMVLSQKPASFRRCCQSLSPLSVFLCPCPGPRSKSDSCCLSRLPMSLLVPDCSNGRPPLRLNGDSNNCNDNLDCGDNLKDTGEDRLWESKFYIPFQPQKWSSNKSNSSVTSSCACCGFLRSRLESQSWNSFNPFPIANRVSAGVPTPPDSGKTPQLKTSKLAQNCGKIEVLHLQLLTESAGVMKSKLFPQCKQRIHPVLNIYYYS